MKYKVNNYGSKPNKSLKSSNFQPKSQPQQSFDVEGLAAKRKLLAELIEALDDAR